MAVVMWTKIKKNLQFCVNDMFVIHRGDVDVLNSVIQRR